MFKINDIGSLATGQHKRRERLRKQGDGADEKQRGDCEQRGHYGKATSSCEGAAEWPDESPVYCGDCGSRKRCEKCGTRFHWNWLESSSSRGGGGGGSSQVKIKVCPAFEPFFRKNLKKYAHHLCWPPPPGLRGNWELAAVMQPPARAPRDAAPREPQLPQLTAQSKPTRLSSANVRNLANVSRCSRLFRGLLSLSTAGLLQLTQLPHSAACHC